MDEVVTYLAVEFTGHPGEPPATVVADRIAAAGGAIADLDQQLPGDRAVLGAVFPWAAGAADTALSVLARDRVDGAASSNPLRVGVVTGDDSVASLATRARELLGKGGRGEVLADAWTAVLVGPALAPRAELVDRGAHRLGDAPPGRVYELRVPGSAGRGASNLGWAHRAVPGPVVGRAAELAAIEEAWRSALQGRRRTVLLTGEAGIGKTTLAGSAALRAHARGAGVLYGRWDPDRVAPFGAVREALGGYADRCPADRLRAELGDGVEDVARLLPEVGARLGVVAPPRPADPERDRRRLFDVIAEWIGRLAARQPTVLVLDDLHGADHVSLLLLDQLHRTVADGALMIVTTERDGETDAATGGVIDALRRDDATVRLPLRGLDTGAVGELLGHVLGPAAHDDEQVPAVAGRLRETTAGNPLFIQHVLRDLVEGSREPAAELGAAITDRLADTASVRELVTWRIAQLPAATAELLPAAAVVGKRFDADLLAAAMRRPATTVRSALEPAVRAGLLRTDDPSGDHRFVHDVVRDALRADLADGCIGELHRRVGAALVERAEGGADIRADLLAHHCLLGADGSTVGTAVRWARLAAGLAARETAFEHAVDLLEQAVAAYDLHADPRGNDGLACVLRLELAGAYDHAGRFSARDTCVLDAARIARALDRTDLVVRAALALGGRAPGVVPPDGASSALLAEAIALLGSSQEPAAARLLARRTDLLHMAMPHRQRRADLDRALAIARRLDDPSLLTEILATRAIRLDGPDDVAEQLAVGDELHVLGTRSGDRELLLIAARVRIPALVALGRGDAARRLTRSLAELAHEVNHPGYTAIAGMLDVLWAIVEGHYERGEASARRLRAGLRAAGHSDADLLYFGQVFGLRWMRGGLESFRPLLEEIARATPESPAWWAGEMSLDMVAGREDRALAGLAARDPAEIARIDKSFLWWPTITSLCFAASAGDRVWADALYDAVSPYAGQACVFGYSVFAGAADLYLGMLALARDDPDGAVAHLERALALHEALRATPFVALAARWLAHALDRRGDHADGDRAAALAARSSGIADRLGLDRLPGPTAPTAAWREP